MATKEDYDTTAAFTGCFGFMWYMCVTLPMWMVLLYQILLSINAPSYAWILFWMYLPAQVIGAAFMHFAKLLILKSELSK